MKKIIFISTAVCLFVFGMQSVGIAKEKIVISGTGDSQSLLRSLARDF